MPHQGDGLNGGVTFEDWDHNSLPHRRERVWHSAAPGGLALGGQARIGLDPAGGAFAEARAGGSDTLAVIKAVVDLCLRMGWPRGELSPGFRPAPEPRPG